MSTRSKLLALAAIAVVTTAVVVTFSRHPGSPEPALRELTRNQLELRNDQLFVRGETQPYDGTVLEIYPDGSTRTSLQIRAGQPHGVSRGYYENGQQEVEEHFVNGTSHGLRTRWHENGMKKSEAQIVDGKIEGTFTRWHDNGKLAARAEMVDGQPHGVSEAFDRTGKRTARALVEAGKVIEREHFEG